MKIHGKVALVTGAAAGIGFAIARELLQNGAHGVVITDINVENGKKAEETLSKEFDKTKIIFMKTDVTKETELEDAFKKAKDVFGKIDILVNNAGIVDDVNYQLSIDVNLQGQIRGILLGLKYLAKDQNSSGGTILNICSTAALELYGHFHIFPIYSATKAGIFNLTRSFGHPYHFNRTGIKIIALCPGKTETTIRGVNRLFKDFPNDELRSNSGSVIQKSDVVGRAAIHVIKNGETASVWVIDQNNLSSLEMPDWEKLKKLVVEGI